MADPLLRLDAQATREVVDEEFEVEDLNQAIESAGSVSVFRATARLRDPGDIEAAWREALAEELAGWADYDPAHDWAEIGRAHV